MDYLPERGHVVWVSLSPTLGHEQSGIRQTDFIPAPPREVYQALLDPQKHAALTHYWEPLKKYFGGA